MSIELDLLSEGHSVVLSTVHANSAIVNWSILAQACGRRAHDTLMRSEALGWGCASIACYEKAAASLTEGFLRQGPELMANTTRLALVMRFGTELVETAQLLRDAEQWLLNGVSQLEHPRQLVEHDRGGVGTLIRERLGATVDAWKAGILTEILDPWFAVLE